VSTFALPNDTVSIAGRDHAARFQDVLVAWSDQNQCGLTDALNAVNTPSCNDPAICELRQIMAAIDAEVAQAYSWDDLDISYDFREFSGGSARDSWRWALSEELTTELMHRLTELNRHRFDELSQAPANALNPAKRGRRSKAVSSLRLDDLFAGDNV